MAEIGVIVNPRAKKNRRRPGRIARLCRRLEGVGAVALTSSVAEIRPAVAQMLREGARVLVSDGGDGALHQVLHALDELDATDDVLVMPTGGGTIDFVAQKVGIRRRAEALVERLIPYALQGQLPPHRDLPSLVVSGVRVDGRPFRRRGFALAAGGIGQRFFEAYYREPESGTRAILRVVKRGASGQLARATHAPFSERREYAERLFRPTHARVTIDGEELPATQQGALHAGAFDIVLGPFRVFPFAREPGAMHLQAGELSAWDVLSNIPRLTMGSAIRADGLTETRGRHMSVEALGDENLDPVIDGELYFGLRSLEVRLGEPVRIACPERPAGRRRS
ncbi:MAG: retinol dehydrogenase [Deltaproteobacteria bacterium]|nr:retinol dehydrogenase [Deltaproteobacteria bacterium]